MRASRNGSGSHKITLEIRENLIERLEATGEQTMRVSILGSTGPRGSGCRQAVALEDLDPLKSALLKHRPSTAAPTTTARRPKAPLMTLCYYTFGTGRSLLAGYGAI